MKDIMIATSNKNKVKEYKLLLEPLGYTVHDLSEIEHEDPEENGLTYEENALIKAKAVKTNMMVISDDSGLEIFALPNELGIHSARFMQGCDYTTKNIKLLEILKDEKNRTARFTCVIALIDGQKELTFKGVMNGHIGYKIVGSDGFGYDPIFIPDGYELTNAQLGREKKNEIGHRGQATRKLLEYLGSK